MRGLSGEGDVSTRPMRLMTETDPPPDRGRLLSAADVATECFSGKVTAQWVRRNVRPKVRLGHSTCLFYEHDVRRWIDQHREGAA